MSIGIYYLCAYFQKNIKKKHLICACAPSKLAILPFAHKKKEIIQKEFTPVYP
jgi:hypothetical protein